jgi:DNA-binding transcriptional LysR family regulator
VTRRLTRQFADIGIAPARFLDAAFRHQLLYSESIRLYCGRPHPLNGRRFTKPEELADQGIILTGGDEPDVISRYRLQNGLGRVVSGQSAHLDEAKRLTLLGIGICFLPEPFVRVEASKGLLWPLLPKAQSFASDIYVVSLPLERVQLPTRLFCNVLEQSSVE